MKNSIGSLPPESKVFVDANIFLYNILGHPAFKSGCQEFLINVENGVYAAITSTLILNEVVHKLMLAEATKIYRLSSERDALRLIKEQPDIISNMSLVWKNYAEIKKYPITISSIDEGAMDMAVEFSKKYGLLISDASHVAIMKTCGIDNIATNDSDFKRVEWINVWKP